METINAIDRFEHEVTRTFEFLVSDFGFTRMDTTAQGPEAAVRFQSATTQVSVKFEFFSGPWVELARVEQSAGTVRAVDRYDLNFLMMERAPGWQGFGKCDNITDPTLPQLLETLARSLREYGADILKGDFSIFPKLRQRAEENLRRTNKELFGVEQP